jgi:hypothetical protein
MTDEGACPVISFVMVTHQRQILESEDAFGTSLLRASGAHETPATDLPRRLFRGVNPKRFAADGGRAPNRRGHPFPSSAQCGDEYAVCGSGIICGTAEANTVVAHQWKGRGAFKTSGISTSPYFERAKTYALHEGRYAHGKVVELDTNILRREGARIFRVSGYVPFPAKPEDDEYVVVACDLGPLPAGAVVRVHDV